MLILRFGNPRILMRKQNVAQRPQRDEEIKDFGKNAIDHAILAKQEKKLGECSAELRNPQSQDGKNKKEKENIRTHKPNHRAFLKILGNETIDAIGNTDG